MSVHIRPQVAALPSYIPGKKLNSADAVKLSSNENPYPAPPSVVAAARQAMEQPGRYPDMFATELCEHLGKIYGIDPSLVVAGNGSTAVISHTVCAVAGPGDQVVMPWRSFEAYPIIVRSSGAQDIAVPLLPDGRHDLPALVRAVNTNPKVRCVMLCSPNNPTGCIITRSELAQFLAQIPSTVLVLLDEAYLDFVTDPQGANGLDFLASHQNLVLLRTFSKAYQLAGLRVGYLLASDPTLAGAVRAVATPFGVNRGAEAAALAALKEESYRLSTVSKIVAQRERLLGCLRERGWDIPQAQGNFFYLPYPGLVDQIVQACASKAITVRPFQGEGVRVSVGLPEENSRFLEAIGDLVPENR